MVFAESSAAAGAVSAVGVGVRVGVRTGVGVVCARAVGVRAARRVTVGGAVLVEYIFAYPGVGYLLYQGIVTSDYTLIQGIVFMLVFTTATLVLILDLTYPLIDPRITFERG